MKYNHHTANVWIHLQQTFKEVVKQVSRLLLYLQLNLQTNKVEFPNIWLLHVTELTLDAASFGQLNDTTRINKNISLVWYLHANQLCGALKNNNWRAGKGTCLNNFIGIIIRLKKTKTLKWNNPLQKHPKLTRSSITFTRRYDSKNYQALFHTRLWKDHNHAISNKPGVRQSEAFDESMQTVTILNPLSRAEFRCSTNVVNKVWLPSNSL